jgi:glycosyltransferase involved in cell wall biosynthesis
MVTNAQPALSVVLCTYNRSRLLAGAIEALLTQTAATPPYEVIVVDNNSVDGTRAVVEPFLPGGIVRYALEPEQGLSVARNHGVGLARADVIAFTDDDVRVSSTWVQAIARAFAEYTDADMVGGKVEPIWECSPPPWLAAAGLAPLALTDFGDAPFRVTPERPVCLIGANVAVRRAAFEAAGGFSPRVQRVRDGVGSTEDHDFQLRVLAGGGTAVYDPRLSVRALVPRERLTKGYYRAWHGGHGRFLALMRDPSFERSRRGTWFGVPAHVYRSALHEAGRWAGSVMTGRGAAAFAHELRLRFLAGYAVERLRPGS